MLFAKAMRVTVRDDRKKIFQDLDVALAQTDGRAIDLLPDELMS